MENPMGSVEVAEHAGPGFTYFARWIGRCRSCKAIVKREETPEQVSAGWYCAQRRNGYCADCDANVVVKMVMGTQSDKKCGGACRSAKGPSCDCSCGGKNHGGG